MSRTLLRDNAAGACELRTFLSGLRLDPAERARSSTNDAVLHELHGDPEHTHSVLASMASWWREHIAVPALTEDDAVVTQLVAGMRYHAVNAGGVICREGDHGSDFFVILAGGAEVSVGGISVGSLGAGDTFGEVALLESARLEREGGWAGTLSAERKATVRAVSTRPRTELAVVTVALFNACLEKRLAQEQRLFKRMESYEAATVQAVGGDSAQRAASRLLQYAAAVHGAGRGRREQAEHALALVERQQLQQEQLQQEQQEQRERDGGGDGGAGGGSSDASELGAVLAVQWERARQDVRFARLATSRLGACLCAISRCATFLVRINRTYFAARGRHVWRDRWLDGAKAALPALRRVTQSQSLTPTRPRQQQQQQQQPEQTEIPTGMHTSTSTGICTHLGELELLRYSLMPIAESRKWMLELQRADALARRAALDEWASESFSDSDTDAGADDNANRGTPSPTSPRHSHGSRSSRVHRHASARGGRWVREPASRSTAPSGSLDERRWEHTRARAQQRASRFLRRVRSALEQGAATRAPSQRQALELLLRRHWLFDVRRASDVRTGDCDDRCALRFSVDEAKRLASALELRRYRNGQQLFGSLATGNIGQCDGLYFVLSGSGRVHGEYEDAAKKVSKAGKEKNTTKDRRKGRGPDNCNDGQAVKAGDSFGAVSLVAEEPHLLGMAAHGGLQTATKKPITKAERVAAAAANVPALLCAHLHTSVHDYGETIHALTEAGPTAGAPSPPGMSPPLTASGANGSTAREVRGSVGEEDALVCAVLPRTAFAPVAASRRAVLLEQRIQCLAAARGLRIKLPPASNPNQDQGEFDQMAEGRRTRDVVWSRPRLLRLAYGARVRVLCESDAWACLHDGSIGIVASGHLALLPSIASATEVEPTARSVPLVLKAGWHDAFEAGKTQIVTALTACSVVLLSPSDVERRGAAFAQYLRNSLDMLRTRITRQHAQLKHEAQHPAMGVVPAAREAKAIAAEAAHRAALAFTSQTPDFRPSVPVTSRLPHRVSPRAAAAWKRFGAVASETDATAVKVASSVPIVHRLNPPPPSEQTPSSNTDVARADEISRELLAHATADAPAHTRQTLYFDN